MIQTDFDNMQLWFTNLNNLASVHPYSLLCGFRRNEGLSLFGKGNIIFFIAAGGIKFMTPETGGALPEKAAKNVPIQQTTPLCRPTSAFNFAFGVINGDTVV